MKPVTSWGRLSADPHHIVGLNDPSKVKALVCYGVNPGVAHGMGRSYGDVCLNPEGTLWITTGLDHFIAFDDSTGRLVCEAGVLLRDIQRLVIPRGWILPVTPGTQLVTVGGAIARRVAMAAPLSLMAWIVQGVSLYLIVHALGYELTASTVVAIYCLGILAGAASFIPGGLGATEAAIVFLLSATGVSQTNAITASIISRSLTLWLAVAIGVCCMTLVAVVNKPRLDTIKL